MNPADPTSLARGGSNLRRLYPIYSAIAREFVIELESCPALGEGPGENDQCVGETEEWFAKMDERIKVHHLRQFVQTSALVNEDVVRELVVHHLTRKMHGEEDRDKVDFLLVQLLSASAPPEFSHSVLRLETVAKLLEPVLGPYDTGVQEWFESLEELVREAQASKSLKTLFTARIIERGREIKTASGDSFYQPLSMVAVARFGFLVRNAFFHLMQEDLNVILEGLRELEARGVTTLDCRKAQFAIDEPINRLRMICQSWKVMFHAEYSSGQPLCILVDLRTAVETALAQAAQPNGKARKANWAKAAAQATLGGTRTPQSELRETPVAGDFGDEPISSDKKKPE
jgi:hypothetical protein